MCNFISKIMKRVLFILFIGICSCQNSIKHTENENKQESTNKAEENANLNSFDNNIGISLIFINGYVENCNKMKESLGAIEWVNSNQLSTTEFKLQLSKIINEAEEEDPEYGLGFDPIFDGQDYPEEGFELVEYDSVSNYLIVRGKKWKDFEVTMKVKKENDKWYIEGCGIVNIPKEKQSKR